jgi:hypothetical protein
MENVFPPLSLFDKLPVIGGGLGTWCSHCGSPSWVVSFVFLDVSSFCSLFFPFLGALVNIWLARFHQNVLPFYVSKRAINYPYLMWCKMVYLFLPFSFFNIPPPCPPRSHYPCQTQLNWLCPLLAGSGSRLEWTSSHQCTSWRWACRSRFGDEPKTHPPYPQVLFFFASSLPQNFPLLPTYLSPTYLRPPIYISPLLSPLLPPTYLPPCTYHLLPLTPLLKLGNNRTWTRGEALLELEHLPLLELECLPLLQLEVGCHCWS